MLIHLCSRERQIYHTKFASMFYDVFPAEEKTKYPTEYKIVCAGPDEKVVGLHIIGDGSSEVRLT